MYKIYLLLRTIYYPFLRFVLPLLSTKVKDRLNFELKNHFEKSKLSKADFAFEVSSEGEFEQVKTIIIYLLKLNKAVEIIYCSKSVESQCQSLSKKFPEQIRLLRLPIIAYSPWSKNSNAKKWLTAKTLIMCRYDFFPELISYGEQDDVEFILLSGSSKNFSQKSILSKWYLKSCYKKFNKIVAVTNEDKEEFKVSCDVLEKQLNVFDFRIINITERLAKSDETIKKQFPLFFSFYKAASKEKKTIIFGSFWDHETELFEPIGKKIENEHFSFFLAPHDLSRDSIQKILNGFNRIGIPVYTVTKQTSKSELDNLLKESCMNPGIWLLDVKGLLCEMYSHFELAYVGGGFGRSVHSLLEPFLAGCTVVCGPKTERSSEYTLICEINRDKIIRINEMKDFSNIMEKVSVIENEESEQKVEQVLLQSTEVIDWLGLVVRENQC